MSLVSQEREYYEVKDALTSMVTCSVVAHALRQAYVKVCDIQEEPVVVTKAELMTDVKRDFRFMKGLFRSNVQPTSEELIEESQYRRDHYVGQYLREYEAKEVKNVNISIQPHLRAYDSIKILDLSGQLQHNGDELLIELIDNIAGSSLEVLILSNNNITDHGLKSFAPKFRSLKSLHTLFLNHNKFSDEGIESLFHSDNFSTSLKILNLSYNVLGKTAAWALGRLFTFHQTAQLEDLSIGGQVAHHSSVDTFFISLLPHLLYPGARKLKKLDLAASGLSIEGIGALVTFIAWTSSVQSLNLTRIPIEPSRYRYFFILALMMNHSLCHICLHACGFRHSEMNTLQSFIATRRDPVPFHAHSSDNQLTLLHFASRSMDWFNQLSFLQHIITQRTVLEQRRIEEEKQIIEEKYTPPPVLRPTLLTKNSASQMGGGVSNVKKLSKYLTLEEILKLNPLSIVSRSRRSVSVIQQLPPINGRYKYPSSIIHSLRLIVLNKYQQVENEIKKKEEKYLVLKKMKSQKLLHTHLNSSSPPSSPSPSLPLEQSPVYVQQTHEKRYQKHLPKQNNLTVISDKDILRHKQTITLIQHYHQLNSLSLSLSLSPFYTPLELTYLSYFQFHKLKKEYYILNTPHNFAHLTMTNTSLTHTIHHQTITILIIVKELIQNEEKLKEMKRKRKIIQKNMKCGILKGQYELKEEETESSFEEEENDEEEEEEEERDEKDRVIDRRGIGRELENEKDFEWTKIAIETREEKMKKYLSNQNYKEIVYLSSLSSSSSDVIRLLKYENKLRGNYFIDRDPSTLSPIGNHRSHSHPPHPHFHPHSLCYYEMYLDYRMRYVRYHRQYVNISHHIATELNDLQIVFLSLQEMNKRGAVGGEKEREKTKAKERGKLQQEEEKEKERERDEREREERIIEKRKMEENGLERLLAVEMMCHDALSLQVELTTLSQILLSLVVSIEMKYYQNVYQYSQASQYQYLPSSVSTTSASDSVSSDSHPSAFYDNSSSCSKEMSSSSITEESRLFSPSCPISYTSLFRYRFSFFTLSTIYLGFYFLDEEIQNRLEYQHSQKEIQKQPPPSSRPQKGKGSGPLDDLHSLISYRSLTAFDEMTTANSYSSSQSHSVSLSQSQSHSHSQSHHSSRKKKKTKPFQPKKGKRMKYPEEVLASAPLDTFSALTLSEPLPPLSETHLPPLALSADIVSPFEESDDLSTPTELKKSERVDGERSDRLILPKISSIRSSDVRDDVSALTGTSARSERL